MPRLRHVLPPALAILLFVTTARPCGPDFPSATFVTTTGPDNNYAIYAAGHLGVIQPGYRTRHLVIAYDYLTHRPLSESEQQQAVNADSTLSSPVSFDDDAQKPAAPSGAALWLKTRDPFGKLDDDNPDSQPISRSVPGDNYETFDNCLSDAFTSAAHTLQSRIAAHTSTDPAVLDWVRGQDAVFSNCGDGKAPDYFGPGTPPPPPPAPHAPAPAPANAPLWLRQDRAYQLAAARFYALDFDTAITSFRAIAADTASPWSPIARYLIARCYIRKANLGSASTVASQPDTAPRDHNDSGRHKTYALAQHELLSLQSSEKSDTRIAALHNATESLLDYINLRLQPDQQAAVLADRLHGPSSARFGQSLIDLTYLRTNPTDPTLPVPAGTATPHTNDMLSWIDDISVLDTSTPRYSENGPIHTPSEVTHATADIMDHWRKTHSTVWLVAALMAASPSTPDTPELLKAASSISPTDPGYAAITYHRLRLQPQNAATRAELLTLLPRISRDENTSTLNLFTALNAATAPTLNDWLAVAGREPAAESSNDGETPFTPPTAPVTTANAPSVPENVCGHPINPKLPYLLFDADAANALNRDMPLRLLAAAAESPTLPENLRFQVAQSAWARALLLDTDGANTTYQSIARRMEPVLLNCRATWKPVFDAYNAATTPTARRSAALLALMRFASTEPSVREGEERRNAFATYDNFRQNWWCTTVPQPGHTVDETPYRESTDPNPQARPTPPPPLFLTAADRAEARTEVAALEKIPIASTYFATQALAWAHANPKDPHTPDILGEADRVLRNSCRKDPPYTSDPAKQTTDPNDMTLTPNLARALFTVLHRNYPNSPWARRYTTWE